jgi:norsolorinic acid ketoreductase
MGPLPTLIYYAYKMIDIFSHRILFHQYSQNARHRYHISHSNTFSVQSSPSSSLLAMSSPLTILITGANRGIGFGLVTLYLARPSTTVIATVRDPSSPSSKAFQSLPRAPASRLIVINLDLASTESVSVGIQSLTVKFNIHALDVVIANAGIAGTTPPLLSCTTADLQTYIDVNAFGSLELYKGVLPLLLKSKAQPKFIYMSSAGGSLTSMSTMVPLAAYGASKALGNFLFKWLALEQEGEEKVVVWCQHPG